MKERVFNLTPAQAAEAAELLATIKVGQQLIFNSEDGTESLVLQIVPAEPTPEKETT